MTQKYLATYLNDHLAGSETALELLEHLERVYAGRALARFAAELHADIAADRKELETLMARWGVAKSRPRAVAGWISEKLSELKLRLDDTSGGPLRQLEILDAVSIGIEGKRLLWRALAAAAERAPALGGVDYGALEQRAEEQRRRVETERLAAATAAFGAGTDAT